MRIFVTGASGWIGSAVVAELLAAGHQVLGLARSDASAAAVAAAGAEVHRGDLEDLDSLRAGAAASDGVVHLGYHHDFSEMARAAAIDRSATDALAAGLDGRGGPFLAASGTVGLAVGRVATEEDRPDLASQPRAANAVAVLGLVERGLRPVVVRFAPTVHGPGDHGFVARLVQIAREAGVSGYLGAGENRWPAVHRRDAARLVALAVDAAPAGTALHATGEEGIWTRAIAEAIGERYGLPVRSVPTEAAAEHFGWLGAFFGADIPASSHLTRQLLGWQPTGATLLEDLASGAYDHA